MSQTLAQRIWERHLVDTTPDAPDLLFIDLHLIHEVTSPQAFAGLQDANRAVHRPDLTLATADHNTPTGPEVVDDESMRQLDALDRNCAREGILLYRLGHPRQGIVHVIGPELGLTQPGMTIVCGDSHTATHGAFGAMAFGVGTSEVEHVLATQCLPQIRLPDMLVEIDGELPMGVTAKDIALSLIAREGVSGGQGHLVEYQGSTVRALSMEGRMTLCNMTVEWGARVGMVAPDERTFSYLEHRPFAPKGKQWEAAVDDWRSLASDADAEFAREVHLDASTLEPHVTWGTNPSQAAPISGRVPDPHDDTDVRALAYMGLTAGTALEDISVDRVFVGSCTNSRIEDLRAAADVARGRRVHPRVRAMVVPGSTAVKQAAEAEGLDQIFRDAGFEWREAGCSMCLGMNPDRLLPEERCASTSNRNFEGRQGRGGRTHLVSPPMAVAAAIAGHLVDVRSLVPK